MTSDDLNKARLFIVIENLNMGVKLNYKLGWVIYMRGGLLYQSYQSNIHNKEIVHKSSVGFNEFLEFIYNLDLNLIKQLYGNTKLFQYEESLKKNKKKLKDE